MYFISKKNFSILLRIREILIFIFVFKNNFPKYFIRSVFLKFEFHDLFYLHIKYFQYNFSISNNLFARLENI